LFFAECSLADQYAATPEETVMGSAVERLAVELGNLSAGEWTRLDKRRLASLDRDAVLDQASYAEIVERLRATDMAAIRMNGIAEMDAGAPAFKG
jgi:hypothetical protein